MPIALTDDQLALAEAVAKLSARHCDTTQTRARLEDFAAGRRPAAWSAFADQGLLGLHLPPSHGGDGAGLVELATLVEETAALLVPGPLLPTVLTSTIIDRYGSPGIRDALLPAFVSGATGATATTCDGLAATVTGDCMTVTGSSIPILGAAAAGTLVLGARDQEGTARWFVLPTDQRGRVAVSALRGVDLTRDIARVRLDGLRVPADHRLAADPATLRAVVAALLAAEASGLARWCQRTGLEYVKVREQFGRTIGEFQAIKHKCARLYARAELIAAAAWDAAAADADEPGQFRLAAATAAVVCAPGAVDLALETVTLLGGIGYTWEHDVHLYWRRAMALQSLQGPQAERELELGRLTQAVERTHTLELNGEARLPLRDRGAAVRGGRTRGCQSTGIPGRPRAGGAELPAPLRPQRQPRAADRRRPGIRPAGADPAHHDHRRMGRSHHPRARLRRAAAPIRGAVPARRNRVVPAL